MQLAQEAVQLGLLESVLILIREVQPLGQGAVRILEPARPGVAVAKKTEIIGKCKFSAGGPIRLKARNEQRKPYRKVSLQQQPAGSVEHARGMPENKALFGRDLDLFIGCRLRLVAELAVLCRSQPVWCNAYSMVNGWPMERANVMVSRLSCSARSG